MTLIILFALVGLLVVAAIAAALWTMDARRNSSVADDVGRSEANPPTEELGHGATGVDGEAREVQHPL